VFPCRRQAPIIAVEIFFAKFAGKKKMLTRQLEYYKNLPEPEKTILNQILFDAVSVDPLKLFYKLNQQYNITRSVVKETIRECIHQKIIFREGTCMEINLHFLIHIYPHIVNKRPPEHPNQHLSYSNDPPTKVVGDYLYALFCNHEQIEMLEQLMLKQDDYVLYLFSDIFVSKPYEPVFHLINKKILERAAHAKLMLHIAMQQDPTQLLGTTYEDYSDLKSIIAFFDGRFEQAVDAINQNIESYTYARYFYQAIVKWLKENLPKDALTCFQKGLSRQQKILNTNRLPAFSPWTFYYLVFLLNRSDPEESAPVFQRIQQYLNQKKNLTEVEECFLAICNHARNEKAAVREFYNRWTGELKAIAEEELAIWIIITLFITNYEHTSSLIDTAIITAKHAAASGYRILALEVAFILTQWNDSPEMQDLYRNIRQQTGFNAVLSRLNKTENWKESLLLLLKTGKSKRRKLPAKIPPKNTRIIYYINPEKGGVRPVLERFYDGAWRRGHPFSAYVFKNELEEGMTEQDLRIAQCVNLDCNKQDKGIFMFEKRVFKEMIGHPFLFRYGTQGDPIDLVEGTPEITILKTAEGYHLKANIERFQDDVLLVKESKNCYRVYAVTNEQHQLLDIIQRQELIIPENGLDTLMEVATHLSFYMPVHFDFVQPEHPDMYIGNIMPDYRIHVRLSPWGNGLKAEMFVKPFEKHPPYCKPGVGGKILFYNREGQPLTLYRDLERELFYYDKLLRKIHNSEIPIDTRNDTFFFEHAADALYLLDVLEKNRDIAVAEWPEGQRIYIVGEIDSSNLNLRLTSNQDWFELQGDLKVNTHTLLSFRNLLELSMQTQRRFIEIKPGMFLSLTRRLKQKLDRLNRIADMTKNNVQINRFSLIAEPDVLDDLENLKTDEFWNNFQHQITNSDNMNIPLPEGLKVELRAYQADGFRWMARLSSWGAGACLADDMGLGKTLQAIALLLHRIRTGIGLVVVPVSIIPNWVNEIRQVAPDLNPVLLPASIPNRRASLDSLQAGDVLILSYNMLSSEKELLKDYSWGTVVLDEAHRIKSFDSKTTRAVMALQASFRLILTGTPVQNNLRELWSLFNFINPGMLGTLSWFTKKYIHPKRDETRIELKQLLSPFILRRTKSSVLKELPPKMEIEKKIRLTEEERAFYEAVRLQTIEQLKANDPSVKNSNFKVLSGILRLRQACCSPSLVVPSARITSTKTSAFLEIVRELKENNHRALVFSQFVSHLSLVREELEKREIACLYMDGSTPLSQREDIVERFQSGETDLFLISLQTGGLGLNLTGADFVVHLDSWWNPAIEDQASDRVHRIGQLRPVTIYRLVAENTIEEKIIKLHQTKRKLADLMLENSDLVGHLSTQELLALLTENDPKIVDCQLE
jgi:SNF2 family DNA or RNA helicase